MRIPLLVLVGLAVITSFAFASAADLAVQGGALQTFVEEVDRPPEPPDGITAQAEAGVTASGRFSLAVAEAVDVSWLENDPAERVTEYRVYRAEDHGAEFELIGTTNGTSYSDNDVEDGETYVYYVTAVNAVGESQPSDEASAVLPVDCAALEGTDDYDAAVEDGDCPALEEEAAEEGTDAESLGAETLEADATAEPSPTDTPEPSPTSTPFPTRGPSTATPTTTPLPTDTPQPTPTTEPTPEPTVTEALTEVPTDTPEPQ